MCGRAQIRRVNRPINHHNIFERHAKNEETEMQGKQMNIYCRLMPLSSLRRRRRQGKTEVKQISVYEWPWHTDMAGQTHCR